MTSTSQFISAGFRKMDADLRFFMECLRETLEEIGEAAVAAHLPWLDSRPEQEAPRDGRLEQAVSIAFQLLNLVEEAAAERTRVLREAEAGPAAEPGCWGAVVAEMAGSLKGESGLWERLGRVRVEPVLTAHPTEAKRAPVMEIQRELARLAGRLEDARGHPARLAALKEEVKAALERHWRSGEILVHKPTVAEERQAVLYYLTRIFPEALPRLDSRLREAWVAADMSEPPAADPAQWPAPFFGTWVGGDRDGHPLVTAEVTAETLAELRRGALRLLAARLRQMGAALPLSRHFQRVPEGLHRLLGQLGAESAADGEEPWKEAANLMARAVEREFYSSPRELDLQLRVLEESLESVGAGRLARAAVWPVRRLVRVFGFHLARLDIRQNSAFHDRAVAQILEAAGEPGADFPEWEEARRLEFLRRELDSPRPFLFDARGAGPEARAVMECYAVLRREIERHGGEGLGSLIVSMTRQLSDLLTVYLLARESGLLARGPGGPYCLLPVVPLFETLEDLERAPGLLAGFLDHPLTQRSLTARAEREGGRLVQQVMIGYSDSNKDCGILASQHALCRAQQEMAAAASARGVELCFFHGRGGTISRGAGPTHRFLAALPPGSIGGRLRLTEQGETIAQKYSKVSSAVYNLELLMAGAAACSARPPAARSAPHPRWEDAWRVLARSSREAYRRLIESPGFLEFYSQATPIDALETSSIGSRPARRDGRRTLASLRAIPWVFSWNQSRFYLPGWFGAGTALETLEREEPAAFGEMREGLRRCPFSYYVFTNIETNAASADEEVMRLYAGLVEPGEIRDRILAVILEEYHRTRRMLTVVLGAAMEARRPRMHRTIAVRAGALRILHERQVGLLREWRRARESGGEEAARLLPRVLLSINAIASGLRTTG